MISFDSTVQRPAREWSRGDASEIDGQIERSKRAGANESKLSEFNALTNPWHAKASATAARGESHWIDPCLLGVRLSVRTHQVPDHALIAGISFPGFALEEFQS